MGIGQYRVEVAEEMLLKAGRLDVEQEEYISFRPGQPRKVELVELLRTRYPERDYEVIEQINGRTIKRNSYERNAATSEQGCEVLDQRDLLVPGDSPSHSQSVDRDGKDKVYHSQNEW